MYLLAWCLLWLLPPAPQTVNLTIATSVEKPGNLYVAVYDNEQAFAEREAVVSLVRPTNGQPISLEVRLPAAGDYVLAAYHDLNGNGELDNNLFGAPAEPYGFSKVPPSKWREPRFDEIATTVNPESGMISIDLKKWKEY
ncbi:MAG: DUF2141 domain-containing protein [Bacteroidota bacterium]